MICEAFTCTPSQAIKEDWPLVKAILEYRTAKWAVDTFNDRDHGMQTMQRNPQLLDMLKERVQAQSGADEKGADAILASMEAEREQEPQG